MDNKILELFKGQDGKFLSGEDISKELKVTRAAVWKHIEKLRQIGYDIEAVPHLGYRLKGIPDKLLPDEIKYKLGTKSIGVEIYSYTKTDSTNSLAYDLAEKGVREGAVVIAEQQSKGRGRLGRRWISPPGGVYLSCIIKPRITPNEIQQFTLVSALGVVDAIKEITGLDTRIKWPNDILINDKKICGILMEMKAETDRIDFIVVGIGINVNVNDKMLPDTATSLKKELGQYISRINIVKALLRNMEREYCVFREKGFHAVRKKIKEFSYTLGRHVSVKSHNAVYEGEAIDIDGDGALIIRLDTGGIQRILSGDIVLVR